jgi:[ribosomal protein S5]-alanine N-acetyltransferase
MTTLIETTRLVLRPFAASDARRLSYLAGDYEVAKMCGRVPHPYPVAAAQAWIAKQPAARASGEGHVFAVTLARDGLIGSCGINPEGEAGVWEIGYWFGQPYWGQGYASEAAAAVLAWARAELGAQVFTSGHFADNPASGRVLQKLGFAHTGSAELFGLARAKASPVERYVWPAGAVAGNHGAHAAH